MMSIIKIALRGSIALVAALLLVSVWITAVAMYLGYSHQELSLLNLSIRLLASIFWIATFLSLIAVAVRIAKTYPENDFLEGEDELKVVCTLTFLDQYSATVAYTDKSGRERIYKKWTADRFHEAGIRQGDEFLLETSIVDGEMVIKVSRLKPKAVSPERVMQIRQELKERWPDQPGE